MFFVLKIILLATGSILFMLLKLDEEIIFLASIRYITQSCLYFIYQLVIELISERVHKMFFIFIYLLRRVVYKNNCYESFVKV